VDTRGRVTIDPAISHGQATIAGTRIPVSVILDNLAAGINASEIHQEYPSLPPDAIQVALAYAAELAREEVTLVSRR
jgi:uncharacterized protein (DUF433 family)